MKSLKKIWWLIAVRGVFAIIIGLFALIWPGITFEVLILILGLYILIEGIVATLAGLTSIGSKHWLLLFLEGIVGIVIGWILFAKPWDIILTLPLFIQIFGIWIILTGILRVIFSMGIRQSAKNEFFMILSGILSVVIGIILFTQPITGLLLLIWLFGFSAIFTGILFIAFAMKVKGGK